MKFLIASITILLWVGVIMIGARSLASNEATVSATVTAQIISVNVEDGAIAYGTVAQSATNSTVALSDQQHAGNTGSATEDLNIRGANSASWTLTTGTPTGEQYRHRYATAASPSIWTSLTTNNQTLVQDLTYETKANTQDFHLEILMSDNTTTTSQQSVNVTIQASAYQ